MSGGEETRLKIAQALSAQVHGILADEPTSHLDREGIDFLIGQLKYFTGALLVISHDRYFLDEIVDKIWSSSERGRTQEPSCRIRTIYCGTCPIGKGCGGKAKNRLVK